MAFDCRIEKCERPIFSQCLCRFHFKCMFTQCSVSDCVSSVFCKNMCRYHYDRAPKELKEKKTPCEWEGCEKNIYMNGLCFTHYREKKFRLQCVYPLCESTIIFSKHMCNKHYQVTYRRKRKLQEE